MLPSTVAASSQKLGKAAIDCAWRQWSVVGGGALAPIGKGEALVDPEALVLAGLSLAPREPRMREVTEAWCVKHSRLLSVGRLTALRKHFDAGDADGLGALARRVRYDGKDHRWSSLVGQAEAPSGRQRSARNAAGTPLWAHPQTLMLRLRLAFGLTAKTDILSIFLSRPSRWIDIGELTDLSGYARSPVKRSVDDLAATGLLRRREGRRAEFLMERADLWEQVLYPPPASAKPVLTWARWSDAYGFVSRWKALLQRAPAKGATEFALAVETTKLIETQPALWHELGVDVARLSTSGGSWAPVGRAINALRGMFERGK